MVATRNRGNRKKAVGAASTCTSADQNKRTSPSSFAPTHLTSAYLQRARRWSPSILQASASDPPSELDIVFALTGTCFSKHRGSDCFKKLISDEASALLSGKQPKELVADKDLMETTSAVVAVFRSRGIRFLQLKADIKSKKKTTASKEKWMEIGDVAAIQKTKSALQDAIQALQNSKKKGTLQGGKKENEDRPNDSPSSTATEERANLARLPASSREQVGSLKALASWDVQSAVKIINIPAFYLHEDNAELPSMNATEMAQSILENAPCPGSQNLAWYWDQEEDPETIEPTLFEKAAVT